MSTSNLAELIDSSEKVVALTGAGISVPSGIPDFRSPGTGLWSQVNPMEVAHIDTWALDPVRFWSFYRERLDIPKNFEPNAAHYALAQLQTSGKLHGIITQNIDGLHQKAGLKDVIEVHGSVRTLSCPCGADFTREQVEALFAADGVPYCSECSEACTKAGLGPQALKPDVVLFGEMLPEAAIERAVELAMEADLLLCIGSTLAVMPVALLPQVTLDHNGQIAVLTMSPTRYDDLAAVRLDGDVAQQLPEAVAALA